MTQVTAQMSISLDGYYAGPHDPRPPGDFQGWMEGPEAGGFFRVTRWVTAAMAWRERLGFNGGEHDTNSKIVQETFESAGAYLMGRRMFEGGDVPWGDEPPFRAPVFVVTHRMRETIQRKGGTSFTFVTDGITEAVRLAKEAAGGKDVAVAGGGTFFRAALNAGVIDQFELHISPVILGGGMRLFDSDDIDLADDEALELTTVRVVDTPNVLHVKLKTGARAPLELDDRGLTDPIIDGV